VYTIQSAGRAVIACGALASTVQAPAFAAGAEDGALEEIVVTATRYSSSVNRVPLAVTAETQRDLDQRGVQTIADLQTLVPGLRLSGREASGNATVAIRGIRQQSATAATTGFYLDETSLQKRSAGGFASQNGTPVPPLFDLDRIEVLRGPQGTLFGGGSEGGTIRYIQTAPSLTDYSSYGRAQALSTKGGDSGYEAGFAIGGPIIEDKLGFRASLFRRDTGGYIDLTDYRDGSIYDQNSNEGQVAAVRGALTWAPSETTKLTVSYLKSRDQTDNLTSSYNLSEPGQLQVGALCFNVPYILSQPVAARAFLVPPAVLPPNPLCNASTGAFVAPGYTVGPFDLDRFQSLAFGPTPTRTDIEIASANFQWQVTDKLELTYVASSTYDLNRGESPQNFPATLFVYPGTARIVTPGRPTVLVPSGSGFNPNIVTVPNGLGLGALIETNTTNKRRGTSHEFRLTSSPDERVSYVVGAYFADTNAAVRQIAETTNEAFLELSGMSIEQRYGVPFNGFFADIHESDEDTEEALFGDVTARFTDRWRGSAGIRVTHVKTSFGQFNYGPNGGTSDPSQALVKGQISETPVTPKLSLQYFFASDDLLYLTAAKGFRAGGVNQVLTSAAQGSLAQYGLSTAVLPKTYDSDTVWSYELGGKLRLLEGRAQINTALYDLEWKDVQTFLFLGDGAVFNVPKARSRGIEIEGEFRPIQLLTLNAALSNTKAEYRSPLVIPGGPATRGGDLVVASKGQEFAQPPRTLDLGARFDFSFGSTPAYARIDYLWQDGYATVARSSGAYSPDSSDVSAQKSINLRLGFERKGFDVNLFALNVTDEQQGQRFGGRSQCSNADCSAYNSYTYGTTVAAPLPRQIGIQLAYRR
jgi:outer membrane receptor protein involved in Fe transport